MRKLARIGLITAAGFLLFLTSVGLFQRYAVYPLFLSLERDEAIRAVQRTRAAMDGAVQRLQTLSRDWATWDESYAFATGKNPEFVKQNLTAAALGEARIDVAGFFPLNPELPSSLFAYRVEQKEVAQLPPEQVATWRQILGAHLAMTLPEQAATGLLPTPDGPLLVAINPMIKGDGSGPVVGTLLLAEKINAALVSDLAEKVGAKLKLQPAAGFTAPTTSVPLPEEVAGLNARVMNLSAGEQAFYAWLADLNGQPALVLEGHLSRNTSEEGAWSLWLSTSGILLAGLVFLVGFLGVALAREQRGEGLATAAPLRQKWLASGVLLTALSGIAVVLTAFYLARQTTATAYREQVAAETALRGELIARQLTRVVMETDAMKRFYAGSNNISPDEFKLFVEPVLSEDRAVLGFFWVPEVPATKGEEFEAKVRAAGFPEFRLAPGTNDAGQPQLHPILFAEPRELHGKLIGTDLGLRPGLPQAMALAAQKDKPVMSAPSRQVVGKDETNVVYIVCPARMETGPHALGHGLGSTGFVVSLCAVDRLVSIALAGRDNDFMDMVLSDVTDPRAHPLYNRLRTPQQAPENAQTTIQGATRYWELRAWPTPRFAAQYGTLWPWGLPATGIPLCILLALYLYSLQTARRRAETLAHHRSEALRQNEAYLNALLDHMPAGVMVIDPITHRIEKVNAAAGQLTGRDPHDLVGELCHRVVCPAEAGKCPVTDLGLLLENSERRLVHANGAQTPILKSVVKVQLDGKPKLIECFVDISERQRLDAERRKLEEHARCARNLESMGLLAGGMAHDFNNLLTTVSCSQQLLRETIREGSPALAHLDSIQAASRKGAAICEQMLACSGRWLGNLGRVDLLEVIRTANLAIGLATPPRATVRYELPAAVSPLTGDAQHLHQLLMNLVTNAAEALPDGKGTITIQAGEEYCDRAKLTSPFITTELPTGPYVFLEVTDTGCGMDDATLARVFDPFFSTKFQGRGLGMASVLGIVRAHQGTLAITSKPGAGTTVRIRLPALSQ